MKIQHDPIIAYRRGDCLVQCVCGNTFSIPEPLGAYDRDTGRANQRGSETKVICSSCLTTLVVPLDITYATTNFCFPPKERLTGPGVEIDLTRLESSTVRYARYKKIVGFYCNISKAGNLVFKVVTMIPGASKAGQKHFYTRCKQESLFIITKDLRMFEKAGDGQLRGLRAISTYINGEVFSVNPSSEMLQVIADSVNTFASDIPPWVPDNGFHNVKTIASSIMEHILVNRYEMNADDVNNLLASMPFAAYNIGRINITPHNITKYKSYEDALYTHIGSIKSPYARRVLMRNMDTITTNPCMLDSIDQVVRIMRRLKASHGHLNRIVDNLLDLGQDFVEDRAQGRQQNKLSDMAYSFKEFASFLSDKPGLNPIKDILIGQAIALSAESMAASRAMMSDCQDCHRMIGFFADADERFIETFHENGDNIYRMHEALVAQRNQLWGQQNAAYREQMEKDRELMKTYTMPRSLLEKYSYVIGDYEFVVMQPNQLNWLGNEMHNCVGGYGHSCMEGSLFIVAATKIGETTPYLCIDVSINRNRHSLRQAKITCNKPASSEAMANRLMVAWIKETGLTDSSADINHSNTGDFKIKKIAIPKNYGKKVLEKKTKPKAGTKAPIYANVQAELAAQYAERNANFDLDFPF